MQYTIADICQELGVTPRTLRNYQDRLDLRGTPSPTDSRVKLFSEEDLEQFRSLAPQRSAGREPSVEVAPTVQIVHEDGGALVPAVGGSVQRLGFYNPLGETDERIVAYQEQTAEVLDILREGLTARAMTKVQGLVARQDELLHALELQATVTMAQAFQAAATRGAASLGEPPVGEGDSV